MDPFTAIGLAGNIVTFLDVGFKIVSATRDIYNSTSGASSENNDLESLTSEVNTLARSLESRKSISQMTDDERNLNHIALECAQLSQDLLDLLEKLKARKPGSVVESLRAVWRSSQKQKEKTGLEKKLEKCQQQLHLQLSSMTRSETLQRLERVMHSGECQEKELASLQRNVDLLRSSLDAEHLSSGDLDQIRSLLDLSDQALMKVYQNLILDGLRFDKMNDRFDEVKEAHLKTFNWILGEPDGDPLHGADESGEHADSTSHGNTLLYDQGEDYQLRLQTKDKFTKWLENGNGIFHVSGKPGAGKSTLMKYLCQHPQTKELLKTWSGEKQLVFADFFFWRLGTEFQKSLKGLLRGLLHCILDECPDLIQTTFPKQWENAKYQRRIQFSEYEVQQAFDCIMQQKTVYDNRKFVFFIDGLDEFEGDHGTIVRRFIRWVEGRADDLKICVSSREELVFQERFSKYPRIRLHELTRRDIAIFVGDTLAANEDIVFFEKGVENLSGLRERIIWKSEGVFLWVSLAIRTLEQGLLAEDLIRDLEAKIDALPAELDDLFQFIFDSITKRSHPVDCKNAIRTLAIAMDDLEYSFPLIRYSFLEEFQENRDFVVKWPVQNMSEEDIQQRMRRSRKQIYARCKGFLDVVSVPSNHKAACRGEAIKFIHRSLAEFLQKRGIQEEMAPLLVGFDKLDFYCQSLLAELKSIEHPDSYFTEHISEAGSDVQGCMIAFHYSEPPDSARFCGFLDQVSGVVTARVPAEIIASTYLAFHMNRSGTFIRCRIADCHPSEYIRFYAMEYGLYEYLLRNAADVVVEPYLRHRGYNEILSWAIAYIYGPLVGFRGLSAVRISLDRMTKSLGYCFESGISANCGSEGAAASYWQSILWALLAKGSRPHLEDYLELEPIIRVFLLYGADPHFWLRFEPRYLSYRGRDVIRVLHQIGADRAEPFEAIYIDVKLDEGIIEFAKGKGWTLSLRDIVEYWFPERAKVLQELIDRNAARQGDPTEEELKALKAMSHMDLDVWKGLSSEKHGPLFKSTISEARFTE